MEGCACGGRGGLWPERECALGRRRRREREGGGRRDPTRARLVGRTRRWAWVAARRNTFYARTTRPAFGLRLFEDRISSTQTHLIEYGLYWVVGILHRISGLFTSHTIRPRDSYIEYRGTSVCERSTPTPFPSGRPALARAPESDLHAAVPRSSFVLRPQRCLPPPTTLAVDAHREPYRRGGSARPRRLAERGWWRWVSRHACAPMEGCGDASMHDDGIARAGRVQPHPQPAVPSSECELAGPRSPRPRECGPPDSSSPTTDRCAHDGRRQHGRVRECVQRGPTSRRTRPCPRQSGARPARWWRPSLPTGRLSLCPTPVCDRCVGPR